MNNQSEAYLILENPRNFSDEKQINYFGFCESTYIEPVGELDNPTPDGMEEYFSEHYNPYTKERKIIRLFKEKAITITE